MRVIRVRPPQHRGQCEYGQPFLVKETNPYFNWYKNSVYHKVVEEFEIPDKKHRKKEGTAAGGG